MEIYQETSVSCICRARAKQQAASLRLNFVIYQRSSNKAEIKADLPGGDVGATDTQLYAEVRGPSYSKPTHSVAVLPKSGAGYQLTQNEAYGIAK